MKFALSKDAAVHYSPGERRLFDILTRKMEELRGGAVDTEVLAQLYYGKRSKVFHPRAGLIRCLAALGRKIEANREPFMVFRTVPCGPHSQRVKLVPCQRRVASYENEGESRDHSD